MYLGRNSWRFDPQSFTNCIGPLSKLVQMRTVANYHATFEQFLNRIEGIPESALIPMFIVGLKEPIQEKVELQQPLSLAVTMALALRLAASHKERQKQFARNRWNSRDSKPSSAAPDSTGGVSSQPSPHTLADKKVFKPIRVSNAEK